MLGRACRRLSQPGSSWREQRCGSEHGADAFALHRSHRQDGSAMKPLQIPSNANAHSMPLITAEGSRNDFAQHPHALLKRLRPVSIARAGQRATPRTAGARCMLSIACRRVRPTPAQPAADVQGLPTPASRRDQPQPSRTDAENERGRRSCRSGGRARAAELRVARACRRAEGVAGQCSRFSTSGPGTGECDGT